MKVVLPFDGSPSAVRAVDYVVALAGRLGKNSLAVELVNVQTAAGELPAVFGRDAADVAAKLTQSSLEEGARLLAAPIAKLEAADIAVKSTVLVGEPAEALAEHVKGRGAEAVVMGTRGLGAVSGLVLGSVAAKIVHLVKVPVTLVK